MKITSAANPRLKALLELLGKSRERKRTGLFAAEGAKEVSMALEAGYVADAVFIPEGEKNSPSVLPLAEKAGAPVFELAKNLWKKAAYRETTSDIMAVFRQKEHALEDIKLGKSPLLLVAEAIEKPGNVGALLRSADAAAVDGVLLCGTGADVYNPNVIRNSAGCVFTVPIAVAPFSACREWLAQRAIRVFSFTPAAEQSYYEADFTGPCALVLGAEDTGLSREWMEAPSACLRLPMLGAADSLNVAATAAIALFEARRQRGFLK